MSYWTKIVGWSPKWRSENFFLFFNANRCEFAIFLTYSASKHYRICTRYIWVIHLKTRFLLVFKKRVHKRPFLKQCSEKWRIWSEKRYWLKKNSNYRFRRLIFHQKLALVGNRKSIWSSNEVSAYLKNKRIGNLAYFGYENNGQYLVFNRTPYFICFLQSVL